MSLVTPVSPTFLAQALFQGADALIAATSVPADQVPPNAFEHFNTAFGVFRAQFDAMPDLVTSVSRRLDQHGIIFANALKRTNPPLAPSVYFNFVEKIAETLKWVPSDLYDRVAMKALASGLAVFYPRHDTTGAFPDVGPAYAAIEAFRETLLGTTPSTVRPSAINPGTFFGRPLRYRYPDPSLDTVVGVEIQSGKLDAVGEDADLGSRYFRYLYDPVLETLMEHLPEELWDMKFPLVTSGLKGVLTWEEVIEEIRNRTAQGLSIQKMFLAHAAQQVLTNPDFIMPDLPTSQENSQPWAVLVAGRDIPYRHAIADALQRRWSGRGHSSDRFWISESDDLDSVLTQVHERAHQRVVVLVADGSALARDADVFKQLERGEVFLYSCGSVDARSLGMAAREGRFLGYFPATDLQTPDRIADTLWNRWIHDDEAEAVLRLARLELGTPFPDQAFRLGTPFSDRAFRLADALLRRDVHAEPFRIALRAPLVERIRHLNDEPDGDPELPPIAA
ncbi:MAG: hypothetical protein Q7T03_10005 [Deltaproteobacteria bacterium]|nr:hypothetical protein [Deltaproteobacteria bacterium]